MKHITEIKGILNDAFNKRDTEDICTLTGTDILGIIMLLFSIEEQAVKLENDLNDSQAELCSAVLRAAELEVYCEQVSQYKEELYAKGHAYGILEERYSKLNAAYSNLYGLSEELKPYKEKALELERENTALNLKLGNNTLAVEVSTLTAERDALRSTVGKLTVDLDSEKLAHRETMSKLNRCMEYVPDSKDVESIQVMTLDDLRAYSVGLCCALGVRTKELQESKERLKMVSEELSIKTSLLNAANVERAKLERSTLKADVDRLTKSVKVLTDRNEQLAKRLAVQDYAKQVLDIVGLSGPAINTALKMSEPKVGNKASAYKQVPEDIKNKLIQDAALNIQSGKKPVSSEMVNYSGLDRRTLTKRLGEWGLIKSK